MSAFPSPCITGCIVTLLKAIHVKASMSKQETRESNGILAKERELSRSN